MRNVNRRDLLKSAAAALVAGAGPTWAQASEITLGKSQVITLSDGEMELPFNTALADASSPEVLSFLQQYNIDSSIRRSPLNLTLLRDSERNVLFDIGAGSNWLPGTGLLLDSMQALGVEPEEITHVVFTHAHPDHLWGLMDDFDEPLLPNAEYLISATEWDYWTNPKTVDEMPEDRMSFAVGAKRNLLSIEDSITRFKDGEEILSGVEAVATHGHTPGHTAFELRDGSESIMVIGDALTHEQISFAKPGWQTGSDQDRALAATTRKKLLDRLQHQQTRMIAYHLPGGGMGSVERDGNAFRFVPSAS